jgi:hypothetical protein
MQTTKMKIICCNTGISWAVNSEFNLVKYSQLKLPVKVRVRVTLRLVVYPQSLGLGVKPLETHDQRCFPQLNPCSNSPYVTSSLVRSDCLLNPLPLSSPLYLTVHRQEISGTKGPTSSWLSSLSLLVTMLSLKEQGFVGWDTHIEPREEDII